MTLDTCPRCGASLIGGPRAGDLTQNWYCTNRTTCRQGFNVSPFGVDAIGEVDDEAFEMYAKAPQRRTEH